MTCSGEELLPSGCKGPFVRDGVLGSDGRAASEYHSETISLPLVTSLGISGWSNALPSEGGPI